MVQWGPMCCWPTGPPGILFIFFPPTIVYHLSVHLHALVVLEAADSVYGGVGWGKIFSIHLGDNSPVRLSIILLFPVHSIILHLACLLACSSLRRPLLSPLQYSAIFSIHLGDIFSVRLSLKCIILLFPIHSAIFHLACFLARLY